MSLPTKSMVESIGLYLPRREVSTDEVLKGCTNEIRFPLEQLSGISSRRMSETGEFAIDLARKAIEDCLAGSRVAPDEIDLLICCNISRFDQPRRVSYEPSSAVVLKKDFQLDRALAFDVSNACAGMFTGVYLANLLVQAGMIRYGLIVSGEYITHLTQTAQKEIADYMDPQLACLTLGDAGAAVIIGPAASDEVGFHSLDMFTLGKYSPLCVAKPTENGRPGATMKTDPIRATALVVERSAMHAAQMLVSSALPFEQFRHFLPHQTSATTITEALSEIARLFDTDLTDNTINNLARRGNTASNTHFVALKDKMLDGTIQAGDSIVFCISGSGMTLGTALYTFDDLPERVRQSHSSDSTPPRTISPAKTATAGPHRLQRRLRLEAIGTASEGNTAGQADTQSLARLAGEACLARSSHERSDVDLLISIGLYRSDFIAEPAAAAMAAGDLRINEDRDPLDQHKTLAFDLLSGPVAFLSACYVAAGLIGSGQLQCAMLVAAETENNVAAGVDTRRGLKEMGSAAILDCAADGQTGFSGFLLKDYPEYLDSFRSYGLLQEPRTHMVYERAADLESHYLACIADSVSELLDAEGLDISQIRAVFPPQISSAFADRLSELLGANRGRFVDLAADGKDLFTSSAMAALEHARENNLVASGDVGLIINVAAGIQVGCAIYHF